LAGAVTQLLYPRNRAAISLGLTWRRSAAAPEAGQLGHGPRSNVLPRDHRNDLFGEPKFHELEPAGALVQGRWRLAPGCL